MTDITAKTLKAMRFAADLKDNEDNMPEDDAMDVTCDQYFMDHNEACDLLGILPDDWGDQFSNYLSGGLHEAEF